jgi:hypothetical protein
MADMCTVIEICVKFKDEVMSEPFGQIDSVGKCVKSDFWHMT